MMGQAFALQLTPYQLPVIASAVTLAALSIACWRQRRSPAAQIFAWFNTLGVVWAVLFALDISIDHVPTKIALLSLRLPVLSALPVTGLALVLEYTGRSAWLTRRRIALLLTPAAVSTVLALTSQYHTLWRTGYRLLPDAPVPVLAYRNEIAVWLQQAWSYGLIVIVVGLLLRGLRDVPAPFTRRAFLMLGGLAVSLVPHVLFEFGVSPIPGYNIAPSVIGISGLVFFWGALRYRVLEVLPIARSVVIDQLRDIVVVVDARGRVVDANRAAREALGLSAEEMIGRRATSVLQRWGISPDHLRGQTPVQHEISVQDGDTRRVFDLSVSPIERRRGAKDKGRVAMLRDITERELAREALRTAVALEAQHEAEERTRREIAELLHGRVQTQLLLLWLQLGEVENRWPDTPAEARTLLSEVRASLDRVREREVRLASHRLYPALLEFGLVPALHTLVEPFESHLTVAITADPALTELDAPLDNKLPMPLRETAYRVVEEALANVERHALASRVAISVTLDQDRVIVSIHDNGRGCDPAQVISGLGLRSIAARAGTVGGSWHFSSAPGGGSTVTVSLPLVAPAPVTAGHSIPPAGILGQSREAQRATVVAGRR